MGIKSTFAVAMIAGLLTFTGDDAVVTDVYDLTLNLNVPQVVNNSESLGRRVYNKQMLKGEMHVTYRADGSREVSIKELVNRSFKVAGENVRYQVETEIVCWNLIGNNRTGVFKKPSVCLDIEAQPSYAWSWDPDSDNSFILKMAGYGSSYKYMRGYVSGTQGCSCMAYGHVSPTRMMGPYGKPYDYVADTAATIGSWRARLKKTMTGPQDSP